MECRFYNGKYVGKSCNDNNLYCNDYTGNSKHDFNLSNYREWFAYANNYRHNNYL